MKGFKKDGKFRPTGNKSKSSLKKSDLRKKLTVSHGEGVSTKVDRGSGASSLEVMGNHNGVVVQEVDKGQWGATEDEFRVEVYDDNGDAIFHKNLGEKGNEIPMRNKQNLEDDKYHVIIKNAKTGEIGEDMIASSERDASSIRSGVLMQGLGEGWFVSIVSPKEKKDKRTLEDGTKLTTMQESTLGKLENGEVLTESDVNHIKNSMNGSFRNGEINESFTEELNNIFSEGKEFPLTDEQSRKGLTWLQKTRIQNKYLGERERDVVANFDHFALVDWASIGNSFYVPVYKVVATNGDSFDYHITGTGSASAIEIVG